MYPAKRIFLLLVCVGLFLDMNTIANLSFRGYGRLQGVHGERLGIDFNPGRMLRSLLTCASSDVVNPKDVMSSKKDSIARFIHVVKPLADVYELPPTSLHVFYDVSGATIAFNRNASLFLNLRFFEAWRKLSILLSTWILPLICVVDDEDVRKGELSKAYISW